MAEIRLSLAEYQEAVGKSQELERQLSEARKEIDELRLGESDSEARQLALALEQLLPVVQFAVATLDPVAYRGWPYKELRSFAEILPDLPGVSLYIKELAGTLKHFAKLAEEWETARAQGKEKEKFLAETAARAVDPATYKPVGATILDAAGKAFGGEDE